jgi:hypothetical protein
MAKPNYSFEKRQKEIAKKQKKEAKLLKKSAHADGHTEEVADQNNLTQPTTVKDVSQ